MAGESRSSARQGRIYMYRVVWSRGLIILSLVLAKFPAW